jgi:hypothetical protein
VRGRANQQRRAALTALQGGRCGRCGTIAPLELHHLDHDPANDSPSNWSMLCRPTTGSRVASRAENGPELPTVPMWAGFPALCAA